MRVIVTGGGTGGHIYPALAVAQGLADRDPETKILYVGTRNGMEAEIVPASGFEFAGVCGRSLPRRISLETLKTAGAGVKALWETKGILKRFHPDLVVGTGGYVSGPVVLTAALFGIPTLLQEQNALPGITNRVLARMVKGVILTFPESRRHFHCAENKIHLCGLPVRPEIGGVQRQEAASFFRLSPDKFTIMATGGSRGARSLNQAMITVAEKLQKAPGIQLIWATGKVTFEETMAELKKRGINTELPQFYVREYLQDIPQALGCADLVIGRAGAASLAEIMIAGKPAILIPYPYAAENHQEYNAKSLVNGGAARMILDKDLSGEQLWQEINTLINHPEELKQMAQASLQLSQPYALKKIVDLCLATGWR